MVSSFKTHCILMTMMMYLQQPNGVLSSHVFICPCKMTHRWNARSTNPVDSTMDHSWSWGTHLALVTTSCWNTEKRSVGSVTFSNDAGVNKSFPLFDEIALQAQDILSIYLFIWLVVFTILKSISQQNPALWGRGVWNRTELEQNPWPSTGV